MWMLALLNVLMLNRKSTVKNRLAEELSTKIKSFELHDDDVIKIEDICLVSESWTNLCFLSQPLNYLKKRKWEPYQFV